VLRPKSLDPLKEGGKTSGFSLARADYSESHLKIQPPKRIKSIEMLLFLRLIRGASQWEIRSHEVVSGTMVY